MIKLKYERSNETFRPMLWKSPLIFFFVNFGTRFFFLNKKLKLNFVKSNVTLM